MASSLAAGACGVRLSSLAKCSAIKAVVALPAANSGLASRLARKRWLPLTPSSTQFSRVRTSLRRASSRVAP